MALGGQIAAAAQAGSRITLTEDQVKLGQGRIEGTSSRMMTEAPGAPSFNMPAQKTDDEELKGGRMMEGGFEGRVGEARGSLGSAGQSPNSPLSSNTSLSSSSLSPSISPGASIPNSVLDAKPIFNPSIGQSNLQPKNSGSKDVWAVQGQDSCSSPKQICSQGERSTLCPSVTGSTNLTRGYEDAEMNSVGIHRENSAASITGNQIFKPYLEKQSVHTQLKVNAAPSADLTGSRFGYTAKHTGDPPAASATTDVGESGMEREHISHTDKSISGLYTLLSSAEKEREAVSPRMCQNLNCTEDVGVGSSRPFNRETKTNHSNEGPQRAAVRRAMSDCSHLSVPMVMAGTYPTSTGGLPMMTPNVLNFTLTGTSCPTRVPYPHSAVRRSLTVTDGTEAAAAMATMMASPLITSPVLPSSPPPKRHHGSCESNFLIPVPPPVGMSANTSQDSKLNTAGKTSGFVYVCASRGMDRKTNEKL